MIATPRTQQGFSLLELVVVIAIVSILITISYPVYSSYVIKTHRVHAQIALLNMAAAMERYYTVNTSYEGTTLANLQMNAYTENNHYQLAIDHTDQSAYLLSAMPRNSQSQDKLCGTLSLNEKGEKSISGTGKVEACWQ